MKYLIPTLLLLINYCYGQTRVPEKYLSEKEHVLRQYKNDSLRGIIEIDNNDTGKNTIGNILIGDGGGGSLFDDDQSYNIHLLQMNNFKMDTILVLAQISDTAALLQTGYVNFQTNIAKKDTTIKYHRREVEWWYLYSVREQHNTSEGSMDAGMKPWAWRNYWKHILYLDENKKPLPKSIIVWQSLPVEGN